MPSLLSRVAVVAGFGVVSACSSGDDGAGTDGIGGSGTLGGSAGASTVGGAAGAPSGNGGLAGQSVSAPQPLEPPEDWAGNIVVQRTRAFGADESAVYVDFAVEGMEAYEAVMGGVTVTCTTDAFGSCKRVHCVYETAGPGTIVVSNPPPLVQLEAGTIQVSARDSGGAVTFSATGDPDPETDLYDLTTTGTLAGGELLSVSADGGYVEGFDTTLRMPDGPLLLSPSTPAGATGVASVPVSQGSDLVFTWDARGTAQSLWLVPRTPSSVDYSFTCRFDATAGTGTVTRDALAVLPVGTELHLFSENYTTLETTYGIILVEALGELLSADQTSYPMFVLE